ncbi:putative single-stranded DNA binding protein [Brevibacillus phage Osiris]|uniref:Single-stranded DNA-binding protein n=3 Tax=Caudoviricetes TaxID=2731619 RepID=S5MUT4_9CAUD|nr:single strand DNA binding protein [Brevibacillus phage Davies]YP_009215089.1 single strand DNA binding protein [Brevibacillus phage Osiris]AGR47592.2 single-stranded DNA binding protein [Brevibacillus phage Davies]ALA07382.1 putative single-stranded DNA binding protein [Brevibacillus phage Osiris]ALA48085.1 single-stranded DNA binding protein [Brevibacillus phage Powder]
MNRVVLIGNLARDVEMKYTTNGVPVATFTLAVNRRVQNGQETDFINIVVWRQLADLCANYLSKGKKCALEGRIQVRSYDDQDGRKRFVTEVIAENVQFLSSKDGQAQQSNKSSFDDPFASDKPINISDDDLPF